METVTEFLGKLASKGVKLSAEAGRLNCYAQRGALTPDIKDGITRYKSEIIALLEGRQKADDAPANDVASADARTFPLTAGQKGLYILQKVHPELSAYNIPLCIKVRGRIDVEMLAKAWSSALDQYPILTARMVERDGSLYHLLDERCRTSIQQQRIGSADQGQVAQLLRDRAKQPFDLDRGPLTRIQLFTRDEQESYLLLTIHHIVFDGVSSVLLLRSLLACYQQLCQGQAVPILQAPVGYSEFVAWEEAMLASPKGLAHGEYWQQQLSGELPMLSLFPDLPSVTSPSFEGATLHESLPEELARSVREFAREQSLRPSAVFLAAFQLLLRRYANQDDVIVGMPVIVRPGQKFMAEVGYFINVVPLRTRCDGTLRRDDFLRAVQRTMLDAVYHSSYPFERMVEKLRSRQATANPVFQVHYAYQNFINDSSFGPQQETLDIENVTEISQEGYADFGLEIFERENSFAVHLKYNAQRYAHEAIGRFVQQYVVLLKSLIADADRLLREYSFLPDAERHRLLVEYNATGAEYATGECLHELFLREAAKNGEAIAIVAGDERLTYEQLRKRSEDLALYLQSEGVGPESLVGVCMERSAEMVVALLGILQAGGAYVPLDPDYPEERLAYMVRDSRAGIVLTEGRLEEKLSEVIPDGTRLIALDTQREAIEQRVAELRAGNVQLRHEVGPENLAYVIYTSGSTGQPKGVAIEHHSPVTLVHWASEVYGREELAGVLGSTSICFDLSVYEIFVTLANGGTIILVPNALGLIDLGNRESVTLINTVPSAMEELVRAEAVPKSVRTINLAGEPLATRLVDRIYESTSVGKVYDLYGPSEDTTYSTYTLRERHAAPSIGRPIANTQVYIVGAGNELQPIGVPGELSIAGDGLARGYLYRPELTEEKFVGNPFRAGSRMYKTGDLARWLEDGTLQYLGRIDTQVKIRGFRIEMGEIEARLAQHPEIEESAVIAQGEGANRQLVAFYRAKGAPAELPVEELRAHLLQTLPSYMVPAALVSVEAIPLSPNGKVDRRALARMDVAVASGETYVAPRNETEQRLVEIWAEVLKVAPQSIGVHDGFFELGGHSLLATQLISKVRRQLEVEVPLKVVFERTTVAQLAAFLAGGERSEVPPIRPVDRSGPEPLPLSFAQERLWFMNQLEPDSAGYNVPGAVLLHGPVNVEQLDEALNVVIARHETLRTLFPIEEGQARQQIVERLDFRLARIDLSHDPEGRSKAGEICQIDARTPFDLGKGPLIRGKVITLGEHEHVLMLNMHHIISDGWSLGVLIKELSVILEALQQGRAPELPPLPVQYVDYSVWQRNWLSESGVLEGQLAYWKEQLAGMPESLDLATDYPRPGVQSFAGATQAFALDAELTGQLKGLAEGQGGTLYMVLLAALEVLLHRYTGQNDLCVGSPIANRQYGETEGLIGMFVNTLALRSRVEGEETFAELLAKVKATCLEAYEHQDAPFEKVVDAVRPQRNLAISPLFQVMLVLQNVDMGTLGEQFERYPLESGISKFDLTMELTETPAGLSGSIEYSTALYKPQTIGRLVEHFVALCRAIATTPGAAIRDLTLLGDAERHRLLVEYNATGAEYTKGGCLHELFLGEAAKNGEAIAIVAGDERLTYEQLRRRSDDLALYLQSEGVGPESLVGVCMERSAEMVVALLGILQAGGAYVPLDPDYPEERLAYMVRDSRAGIVLTEGRLEEKLSEVIPAGTRLIALDTQREAIEQRVAELKAENTQLRHEVGPENLAYVIYTSGSTGQPKGVAIEHHSPVTLVHWASEVYSREELAGVLGSTSICFDLSVYEIFVTLANGGTIILVPNALGLIDLANRESVTLINTVPSAMEELVRAEAVPKSVRTINLAGEPLATRLVDRIYESTSVGKVYDLYGPSEDTTYSTYTLRERHAPPSIGRPIANTQVYIVGAGNELQPIGVPGELSIAGEGLARGYLYRPELTEEKFVGNPFRAGSRMYKTGDLARWLEDGTLQYLGRIDTQVKIRGFRIEMGEIEARLAQHPEIEESAVIAQGEGANRQLVAFYRAKGTLAELSVEELRAHLLQTLPSYMVPAALVSVEAIPLSPNGKVDRRALARMDVAVASGETYVAPRNETEQRLVEIWAEVLKLAPQSIGVHDGFFELGGHSLLATQLISKVRRQLEVEVPLKVVFERTTVAQLAAFLAGGARSEVPPIRPVDRSGPEPLPLSFAQERLWFMNQLEPDSAGYNVPGAVLLHGPVNVEQLDEALNVVIARHETLRTLFPIEEGQARQQIVERLDFRLARIDLSHDPEGRSKAGEICQIDARTPFDLGKGPLIRGKVITLGEHEHVLMLNMHHIISDGWSLGVLIKELSVILEALQQGRSPELPPLPVQYVDYSVWQRNWLSESGVLEGQLAYWKEQLAGMPESLDLVTDYPRPGVQSFAGATQAFALDAELTGQLKGLAEGQGGTLYMVLLAALEVLLHRYTGQNDLCVGSPIANRQYGETEGLIGMFVNTLALRSRVEGEETFAELLAKVKATCLEAYEHQDAPFEKVVDAVRPQRNLAISPLFQVMLVLQNVDMGTLGEQFERYPLESGISKFDLTMELTETPAGLSGSIEYSTALYKPQTIGRLVEHFVALCRAIATTPGAAIRDLTLLGDAERHRLLVEYNATGAEYTKGECLHELFLGEAAKNGEAIAIVAGDERLTYEQLRRRSDDLALYLQSEGVGPESLVGVCMERSAEMVVALLGILQAGGAYVPLDPDYPEERLAYMVRDSRAGIVLTEGRLEEKLSEVIPAGTRLIALDTQREAIEQRVAELKAENTQLRHEVGPENLAYVIYTSGSTGQPKGVAIEHHSPVTLVHWASEVYSREELAGVLGSTSICFDLSVYEIFVTLANGGTIILVPNALGLIDLANRESVTLINTVPSAMEELVRAEAVPKSVRTINLAGEPLATRLVDRIYESTSVEKVYDLYGPSEDTTYSTYTLRERHAAPSIGRPIANTQVYIVGAGNELQPIGVPGELSIAGEGLARGYLYRPELTEEKFVGNPFRPGSRMYKTGDLARWLEDGTLQYLGRIDTQVKIRGFRIEMGEIEARLAQHPEIEESAVIAQGEGANRQLVAFYRAKQSSEGSLVEVPHEELRAHLLQTLPSYMVPAALVSVEAIPLSPNGKVDRRALARMDVAVASGETYVAPRNETERRLVEIWAEVLKLAPESIGVHDGFFELGGHSLSAVQLVAKINRSFTRLLPLATLFAAPTIAALANLISADAEPALGIVVPMQTEGRGQPIFAVPGAGGNVLSLQPLSRALGGQQPFYGLQAVGLDGKSQPFTSVEETAKANVTALRSLQPIGPYSLLGHSYGGVVAYEMARTLLEQGEEVSSLILLDSIVPAETAQDGASGELDELVDACMTLARLYEIDLPLDVERLRHLPADERAEYLIGLLAASGVEIDGGQFLAFHRVYRANLRCYRAYVPSVLPREVNASLYLATRRNGDGAVPADGGWDRHLLTPIRRYDVDADHFSILKHVVLETSAQTLQPTR